MTPHFMLHNYQVFLLRSLKNESVLDVAKYETLKQEFEEKLGIYDENGEGFNTNPYNITVNPSYANQLSVLEISLSRIGIWIINRV